MTKQVANLGRQNLIIVTGGNFDMIPHARYIDVFIHAPDNSSNVFSQHLDEAFANRGAFDDDFREQFNDELHGSGGLGCSASARKDGTWADQIWSSSL